MKENKANVNNNNLSIYKTIFVSLIFILIGISLFILWARHELLFGLFPGIFFILLGTFLYTHGLAIIKKKTLSSKIPKVISISFIIVILITSTLIWVYTEQDYIYKYKIEINPTNNESFSVILPIPIDSPSTNSSW